MNNMKNINTGTEFFMRPDYVMDKEFFIGQNYGKFAQNPKTVTIIQDGVIIEKSTQDFEKEKNFTWIEGFVYENGKVPQRSKQVQKNKLVNAFYNFVENIDSKHSRLGLLHMGNDGFGIIATEEIKPFEVVTFYAGFVINTTQDIAGDYILRGEKGQFYDAQDCGNLSRFFQHLPKSKELIENDSEFNMNIATENVQSRLIEYGGYPVKVFYSIQSIHPGEVIGFSYGMGYWNGYEQFCLFDKKGKKLGIGKYSIYSKKIVIDNNSLSLQSNSFFIEGEKTNNIPNNLPMSSADQHISKPDQKNFIEDSKQRLLDNSSNSEQNLEDPQKTNCCILI